MCPTDPHPEKSGTASAHFASTHWSVVFAAAHAHAPEAEAALDTLCTAYWSPLYAFLRRKGYAVHEAEDLTQDFFARRVITKLIFSGLNPTRGKFRTWLLNSFQNFIRNEWNRQRAQKRGGRRLHISLDFQDAEGRYLAEPRHDLTPEKLYERAWATTLLERVLNQLRVRYQQNGRGALFEELKCYLPGASSHRPHAEAAHRLGKSENAIKMAVSRLRREFGELLRNEIQRTVANPSEVEEELQHLITVIGA